MEIKDGKVEMTQEEYDTLIKEKEDKLAGVVSELTKMRGDKSSVEAERDALTIEINALKNKKPDDVTPPAKSVEDAVQEALAKRESESAKKNRETAEAAFRAAHKEFATDADPGGIKWAAFLNTLARLNATGLTSVEDFTGLFNDALRLMGKQEAPKERILAPGADTPSDGGSPDAVDADGLTPKEKKVIEGLGWTVEKYLKQKKTRPDYIADLLQRVR